MNEMHPKSESAIWGNKGYEKARIRAKIARFPYYNGEYRNETFDVEKIPHPVFGK